MKRIKRVFIIRDKTPERPKYRFTISSRSPERARVVPRVRTPERARVVPSVRTPERPKSRFTISSRSPQKDKK